MKLTGAQILLKCLEAEGVDVMFGFSGGAVNEIGAGHDAVILG